LLSCRPELVEGGFFRLEASFILQTAFDKLRLTLLEFALTKSLHKTTSMSKASDKILAIDIGGSHIKCTILNSAGKLQLDYEKVVTPQPATPPKVMAAIKTLVKKFPAYNKIAVGFPGYVKNGVVITAPNLDSTTWPNTNLTKLLTTALKKPTRVVNDADMQGLGVVKGTGLEMMLTLGTGFGTALLNNGLLLPHLELAHHPISKKQTYDDYIGEKALKKLGDKKWNERLQKIISILKVVFNYDTLYIGGGNAARINFELDKNIKIVNNEDGIHGGAKLWAH
jgi:polyphosphate glucokinase